ncbi:MAG: UPF0147 family protein [Candidatus Nanohaloarchaeota archaeon QJJ-5]|nr:UPF0147 family protein [Candidatus Nanohaloarchaeota archaeon QJJ-5]
MGNLETVITRMEDLQDNGSIPSNVKDLLDDSIAALEDDDEELSVRINTATSFLDEISNDPNIAQHTRTEVWNIASMLESIEE